MFAAGGVLSLLTVLFVLAAVVEHKRFAEWIRGFVREISEPWSVTP